MTTDLNKVYSVIWKYKIKYETKETFEFEYGRNGAWAKLFSQSKNYLGTFLYKSEDEIDTYILIDTWINKQSYEDFIKINQDKYKEISSGFECFYMTEEKTGSFYFVP